MFCELCFVEEKVPTLFSGCPWELERCLKWISCDWSSFPVCCGVRNAVFWTADESGSWAGEIFGQAQNKISLRLYNGRSIVFSMNMAKTSMEHGFEDAAGVLKLKHEQGLEIAASRLGRKDMYKN